jgi:hypothetical protein
MTRRLLALGRARVTRLAAAVIAMISVVFPAAGPAHAAWQYYPITGSTSVFTSNVDVTFSLQSGACGYEVRLAPDFYNISSPSLDPNPPYDVLGTLMPGAPTVGGRPDCNVTVTVNFYNWDLGRSSTCFWPSCSPFSQNITQYSPDPVYGCQQASQSPDYSCGNGSPDVWNVFALGDIPNATGTTIKSIQFTVQQMGPAGNIEQTPWPDSTNTILFDTRMCSPNGLYPDWDCGQYAVS